MSWHETAESALGLYHPTEVHHVNMGPIIGFKWAVWCECCDAWVNARGSRIASDSWYPLWNVRRTAEIVAQAHTRNLSIVFPVSP